jgi:hypothetical protein
MDWPSRSPFVMVVAMFVVRAHCHRTHNTARLMLGSVNVLPLCWLLRWAFFLITSVVRRSLACLHSTEAALWCFCQYGTSEGSIYFSSGSNEMMTLVALFVLWLNLFGLNEGDETYVSCHIVSSPYLMPRCVVILRLRVSFIKGNESKISWPSQNEKYHVR